MPPTTEQSRWFASEVQPHEPALRAYLQRKFPSLSDIDDLVQDTYVRLFEARAAGKVAHARPYLFVTARNLACDMFRRRRVVPLVALTDESALPAANHGRHASDTLSHEQEITFVTQAIAALPQRCRQVLTLAKLYGLPHREVAQRLGISEHTVNAQVALGVLRCRNYFRSHGLLGERTP